MVAPYGLGRDRGGWETSFRTDGTALTKKPRKHGARNLDDFDAVAFSTDGDLDSDASRKADLLSFVRDDGKGFLGVHGVAITFAGWPESGAMLGGYDDGHPWGTFPGLEVVLPAFLPRRGPEEIAGRGIIRRTPRGLGSWPGHARSRARPLRGRTGPSRRS